MDNKSIIEAISEYQYVSFDIFDTLIERNVEKPTDIFFQVGVGCFSNYEMDLQFEAVCEKIHQTIQSRL